MEDTIISNDNDGSHIGQRESSPPTPRPSSAGPRRDISISNPRRPSLPPAAQRALPPLPRTTSPRVKRDQSPAARLRLRYLHYLGTHAGGAAVSGRSCTMGIRALRPVYRCMVHTL